MKVSLKVSLDSVDRNIINSMSTIRFLKVHEIRTIMEYNGYLIGYGELSARLKILSILSIVEKQKTSRVYSYRLSGEFASSH
ncbi:hypothetical protein [Acidiplasma sp. MBA-1]|uniref:hypothetical protein n=1 Tax=Acidiplasma sp. MBA-1 TaxID=1293648 RepID=UPI0005DE067C|nr:hypothetical protein [Acidiplasma sp. MBA-1]KJE49302.1 hypothetical protein TZ01_04415 [Acidiplasma sp. MBA-1]